jgi:uncharacterized protein (TIGR02145 family)
MRAKLIAVFLMACCAHVSYSQEYNIKDGGAEVTTISLYGTSAAVNYQGQYIKKVNDVKGFFPHGKGSFFAHSGYNNASYSGDFFEGRITGVGVLTANNLKYEGQMLDGYPSGEGGMTWTGSSVEGFLAAKGQFTKGVPDGQVKITYKSGNIYEGMTTLGKLNGQGKLTYVDGSIKVGTYGPQKLAFAYYEGSFVNGEREGAGATYFKNGEKLEGQWSNDLFTGTGTLSQENGDKYTGTWKAGFYDGQGRVDYISGDSYTGHFTNGQKNGKGFYLSKGGSKQDGDWNNGKYTGYAELNYSDGGTYKGNLVNDMIDGQGVYVFANGNVLDGIFKAGSLVSGEQRNSDGTYSKGTWDKDGVFHGQKKLIASNKSIWEGEWEGDMPVSKGKVTYENGNVYEGEWMGYVEGNSTYFMIRGMGKMSYPSLGIYEGKFSANERDGNGKFTYDKGDAYDGQWKKGLKSGYGTMTYANGDVYVGSWENDVRNGFGTFNAKNGDKYEGNWVNDSRNGKGTQTYVNGKVETGDFENDKYFKTYECPTTTLEGGKVFMAQNLDVKTFRNGDAIKFISSESDWIKAGDASEPACCCYEYKSENCKKYGVLYNYWATVDSRGLAPRGWRIMNEGDIKTLQRYTNLSIRSTAGWKNGNGTNTAKLNILPSGQGGFFQGQADLYYFSKSSMNFRDVGEKAVFWYSSNDANYTTAPYWDITTNEIYYGLYESMKSGLSVRCVKE